MGKPKGKLTAGSYDELKEYAQTHTIDETANHFGVSASTVSWVKRYDSYREMKQSRNNQMKSYYDKKKTENTPSRSIEQGGFQTKGREIIDNPFPDTYKPKPVVPVEAKKVEPQDSEPITTPMPREDGKTIYEWMGMAKQLEQRLSKITSEAEEEKLKLRKALDTALAENKRLALLSKQVGGVPANVGTQTYDNDHIYVTIGETKLVIPICN